MVYQAIFHPLFTEEPFLTSSCTNLAGRFVCKTALRTVTLHSTRYEKLVVEGIGVIYSLLHEKGAISRFVLRLEKT